MPIIEVRGKSNRGSPLGLKGVAMKKSTKVITSSIAVIFMLLLGSCAGTTDNTVGEQSGPANGHFYVEKVDTDAGEVICIVYENIRRAGLSCNW